MRAIKYALFAIGGLLVLVIAAVAFVAATFDPNRYKAEIEKQVKERTGRTLKFQGNIGLAFWPSIGARVGKVTLSRRASANEFASLDSAHVSVALLPLLRREVQVDQVSVDGLKASVIRAKGGKFDFEDLLGAAGKGATKPPSAGAPSGGGDVKFDVAGIRLTHASFAYVDEGSGQHLEIQDLDLSTGRIAEDRPAKLALSAHVKGKNPALDMMVSLEGSYRLSQARQEYALSGMTLKVDGAAAGVERLALSVSGSAQARIAKEAVDADLVAKFDDTTLKAKLGMTNFKLPHATFDVDVDRIDLDRYLKGPSGGKPAAPAAPATNADVPVDLSPLEGLHADGKIAIGALKIMDLRISELKAQLHAANGRAELAPHSAKLYDGSLQGALSLAAKGNRVALKENLEGVAIGPLVKDLMGRDVLEGHGAVALDVSAAGATVNAMKKALDGTARVALRDGAVKGINLTEALRKAKAALGSKSAQQQPADQGQRTDFSAMTATFVIRNGVAHNDDLDVKAPLVRVGGAGDIDIGNSQLNYLARATVVATAKGQGGADLEQLAGLTIPVQLSGPFDAPRYEVDYRKVAGEAAKAKVTEKAKTKLQDKLRGLLKR
jgi:AsmA protein